MEHDGRAYTVDIPGFTLLECEACKTRFLTDAGRKQLTYALRKKADLLLPEEIRAERVRQRLTQEQLANYLKVAKETVSRWETGGQIQQRAMDLLLRIFFGVPYVRHWLDNPDNPFFAIAKSGSVTMLFVDQGGTVTIPNVHFGAHGGTEEWTGRYSPYEYLSPHPYQQYINVPASIAPASIVPVTVEARMKNKIF
jgi:DNA-binding transcriptional regulator YiaG